MKTDLSKDVAIESIVTNLFRNNNRFISIENGIITDSEKEILEATGDADDPDISLGGVYNNIAESNSQLLSLRSVEKCSKMSKSKEEESLIAKPDDTVIINDDDSRKEFEMSTNSNNDANDNNVLYAAVGNESEIIIPVVYDDEFNKKYWELMGRIVSKVHESLIMMFKRIHNFMCNEMVEISSWMITNGEKEKEKICSNESVSITVKSPKKLNFVQFLSLMSDEYNSVFRHMTEITYFYKNSIKDDENVECEKIDEYMAISEKMKEIAMKTNISSMEGMLFDEDKSFRSVTSKEFFETFSYDSLKTGCNLRGYLFNINFCLRFLNDLLVVVDKGTKISFEDMKYRVKLYSTITNQQIGINAMVTNSFWVISLHLHLIRTAFTLCKKVSET